jgi:hypothetical protein
LLLSQIYPSDFQKLSLRKAQPVCFPFQLLALLLDQMKQLLYYFKTRKRIQQVVDKFSWRLIL